MKYIERTKNGKTIYGWGAVFLPRGYEMFSHIYSRVTWAIGPFVKGD